MQLTLTPHPASAASRAAVQGVGDGRLCRRVRRRWRRPTSGSASARRPSASSSRSRPSRSGPTSCGGRPASKRSSAPDGETAYREWNFAPSAQWAAYDFTGYREGMRDAEIAQPPYIRMEDNLTWWTFGATIAVDADDPVGARPVRGARGEGRHQILLGARPSARRSPISTIPIASPRGLPRQRAMTLFGIDRLLAEPELRRPLEGKRVALARPSRPR